jgi:hypothetical protein
MKTIYQKALLPNLEGALSSKLLKRIPAYDELLETAHILPAKNNARPKPIIDSFYSRNMQAMIFRLMKEFSPYEPATTDTSSRNYKAGRRTQDLCPWQVLNVSCVADGVPTIENQWRAPQNRKNECFWHNVHSDIRAWLFNLTGCLKILTKIHRTRPN